MLVCACFEYVDRVHCAVHLIAYCRVDSIKCTSTAALVSMFKFNLAPKNSCRVSFFFSSLFFPLHLYKVRPYTCSRVAVHIVASIRASIGCLSFFFARVQPKKLHCFSICSFPFLFDRMFQPNAMCLMSAFFSLLFGWRLRWLTTTTIKKNCPWNWINLSYCY